MALDLQKFIGQAEEQLRPSLERQISRLATREHEERLLGEEKLQQAGRFTSGYRAGWLERVMDIYEGYKMDVEATMGEKALSSAQFLYGLAHEAELQDKRLDAEARMKELDRKLTQQGWSVQAKQNELNRQLTREGWDWQSKESILDRALTREEWGATGRGVTTPTYTAPTTTYKAPTVDTSPTIYEKAKKVYQATTTATRPRVMTGGQMASLRRAVETGRKPSPTTLRKAGVIY